MWTATILLPLPLIIIPIMREDFLLLLSVSVANNAYERFLFLRASWASNISCTHAVQIQVRLD
jgi:hypothetical protein